MEIEIRKPNWDNLNENGTPRDCVDVMEFFNKAVEIEGYPYVPRLDKITEEEIKRIWVPSKNEFITYVAYSEEIGKVIGSGTLSIGNNIGELALTINMNFQSKGVGTKIAKAVIKEALSKNITVSLHTSIENKAMQRVMEKLGYKPKQKIENYGKYIGRVKAKTADVFQYIIKP